MTGKERISALLAHRDADCVGSYEHFWTDTHGHWVATGQMPGGQYIDDYFDFDINNIWGFNLILDLNRKDEIIEESEDWLIVKNGNGATLKQHKKHVSTPEHIAFDVTDGEEYLKRLEMLKPSENRVYWESYEATYARAKKNNRFFTVGFTAPFEHMHSVMGHENLLVSMALEPEMMAEVAMHYARMLVEEMKIMFARSGKSDGVFVYEDLGFKDHPFISNNMYIDILQPAHKYIFDYAHENGLPVILHSCGYVAPLIPEFIKSGIDCLQALEVKAGMNLIDIAKTYGKKIALMGGMDVRCLYAGSKDAIDKEVISKLIEVKKYAPYILHSDHSIPSTVSLENYRYFRDMREKQGKY